MAELATIARPYAEAAFGLARDENALPAWSEMLRFAATIVADPRVATALDNPRLTTLGRMQAVREILDRYKTSTGKTQIECTR